MEIQGIIRTISGYNSKTDKLEVEIELDLSKIDLKELGEFIIPESDDPNFYRPYIVSAKFKEFLQEKFQLRLTNRELEYFIEAYTI